MNVKPTDPTAVIRDPQTKQPLPAEGKEVPDNVFWNRRLNAGEVELVSDTTPPASGADVVHIETAQPVADAPVAIKRKG